MDITRKAGDIGIRARMTGLILLAIAPLAMRFPLLSSMSGLLFSLTFAFPARADVRVIDGDTIKVDGQSLRLTSEAGPIDAPESGKRNVRSSSTELRPPRIG